MYESSQAAAAAPTEHPGASAAALPRRIAMVAACPFPSPQGSQVFVGQMCERLAARGHEVHLLTYGQGREIKDRGYRHHRIRRLPGDDARRSGPTIVKPMLDLLMVAALDGLVAEQGVELLHCHNYEAAVVGLAVRARRRLPVVYHSHNLMGDELATYFARPLTRALAGAAGRFLDATVPSRVDHAVALCEYSRGVLIENGVVPDRVSVIPAAVDDDGPAQDCRRARELLALPADEFLVGYCGNLDGYQNLSVLLDAIALVGGRSDRHVRLVIATHALRNRLDKELARRGIAARTSVVGLDDRYERVRTAMAACDVLVLPRRRGSGYPIKLLNYMSAGRAIITAGCGGKVLRDAVEGIVVPDDDCDALAEAIAAVAADPELRMRLAAAARERFLTDLTWDRVLPRIEAVYETVAGRTIRREPARAV